jgi:hypothetical protein
MIAAMKLDIKSRPARWGLALLALLLMIDVLSIATWMSFSKEKIQKTSASASTYSADASSNMSELLNKLRGAGADPSVAGNNKTNREPFSVPGVWVTFSSDNVQVFEYADRETATREALEFLKKNDVAQTYMSDSMLVVYTGDRKDIASILTKAFGQQID